MYVNILITRNKVTNTLFILMLITYYYHAIAFPTLNTNFVEPLAIGLVGGKSKTMKIIKQLTGQTTQVLLRENNSVDVLSYNDSTHKFELDYSIQDGGIEEFEMQVFFKFK